ncbi:hypothetical protein PRIPAC_75541, partial [Pristionchus pacificus]|uniref:Uncharacterized protein n=1 Tax=Pristionchus pacificus TaxID=54126 RepID=A0A2A6C5U0_PRIPA
MLYRVNGTLHDSLDGRCGDVIRGPPLRHSFDFRHIQLRVSLQVQASGTTVPQVDDLFDERLLHIHRTEWNSRIVPGLQDARVCEWNRHHVVEYPTLFRSPPRNLFALLMCIVLVPRALTFLAWQCYTTTQLFILHFLYNAEQAKLSDKSWRIALGILFNVIISLSIFVGFTAASIFDFPGYVIAMVLPVVYAWIGVILSYAVGWHLDRKYPKVMRLQAEIAVETKTNAISSLRLFNRPGGFIHCVLMLVGLFFNLLNENTVIASMGGLSISLFLWRTLEAQLRANQIKSERTPIKA